MLIRKAVKQDLDKIYFIERDSFPEPWSKTFFTYFIDSPDSIFLVAVEEDVIGYIICSIELLNAFNKRFNIGHLQNLAVQKEYRRRKIASNLLNTLLEEISKYKPLTIYLEVACSNQAAVQLYLKFNFTIISVIQKYYRKNGDAYLMAKTIL